MEVYKDRLLFRRYDCLTGKEYKPDAPWIIPLPFDKNTAPYAPVLRSRTATAPEFPQNAKLVFAPGTKFAVFSFPHARHADGVYRYKTEIFHLKGKKKILSARRDQPGNFTDLNVTQTQISLNNGYFQAGERYSVRVTPMNFQDKEGRSLEIEFTFPAEKKYKICFESRDPAVDCKVFDGSAGEKRLTPDPEGFFTIPENRIIRLVFPGNIWPGKAWTPYRFTLEMQLKDSSSRTRLMELRNLDPRDAATGRILLPGGDAGNLRYIFYHSKREDNYNYQLFLLPGSKGKVRFSYVKSERLDSPVTPRSVK